MYVARALWTRGVVFISVRSIFIPVEVIFIAGLFGKLSRQWPSPADRTVVVGTPSKVEIYCTGSSHTHTFELLLSAIVTCFTYASYRFTETTPPINNNVCFLFQLLLCFVPSTSAFCLTWSFIFYFMCSLTICCY